MLFQAGHQLLLLNIIVVSFMIVGKYGMIEVYRREEDLPSVLIPFHINL
jgi:hypothetical protein